MKKIISCLVLIAVLVLSGCGTPYQKIEGESICNAPYIEYKKGDCCLDKDSNGICDTDEKQTTTPIEETKTTAQIEKETSKAESPKESEPLKESQIKGDVYLDENGFSTDVFTISPGKIVIFAVLSGNHRITLAGDISPPMQKGSVYSWRLNNIGEYNAFDVVTQKSVTIIVKESTTKEWESSNSNIDLSMYPFPFIADGKFNAVLVIGDKPTSKEIESVQDIAMSLEYSGGTDQKIDVGQTRLASEIDINNKNVILIGTPCSNKHIMELYEATESDCDMVFSKSEGQIKLVKKSGKYILVVSGKTDNDVRKAATILSNYGDYELTGTDIRVGGSTDNPIINVLY